MSKLMLEDMVHVSHFLSVFLNKEMVWDNMNTMNKKRGGGDSFEARSSF